MVYFLLFYNFFRFGFLNLFFKNFKSSLMQRVNTSVSIKLLQNGSISLGKNLDISKNCTFIVTNNGQIIIGEKVFMNQNCSISSKSKITIGDNCNFGPNVCIFDNDHKFTAQNGVSVNEYNSAPISIESGTWIASNVVILKNAVIGKNCVIAAGCIINCTIPDGSIVVMDKTLTIKPIT